MVQMKSFKWVEPEQLVAGEADQGEADQGEGDQCSRSSPTTSARAVQLEADAASGSSTRSSISSTVADGGGNLTSASSQSNERILSDTKPPGRRDEPTMATSERRVSLTTESTLSSNEEYQSAVHEMLGDDGQEEQEADNEKTRSNPKSNANLEQGRLVDIAKQRAVLGPQQSKTSFLDDSVTRISIEKGSIISGNMIESSNVTLAQHKFQQKQQKQQQQQQPATPRALRLVAAQQLQQQAGKMARSQTSPSMRQLAAGWSRAAQTSGGGDNMSQISFSATNKSNQFEIRWQNVRLFARQNNRLPKFISENALWQCMSKKSGPVDAELIRGADVCYSPPVQHKWIPATIDELQEHQHGLEMVERAAPLGNSNSNKSSFSSIYPAPKSFADRAQPSIGCKQQQQQPGGRCILNNISGQVFSGQITAILGPSGVGKTTLLSSLTGRNKLEGSGRVNLIGAGARKRMSVVTVPQIDVLPGKLTSWEDLVFTSRLKNPQAKFEHRHNIERIIKHLQMEKFLHTRIDKLSGGEQRRLSIARELLASPDIMILDEPTSGLDANTCKKIITALRDIVEHSDNILDKPMSIIVTIHQPQREVYNLFHRVYVMAIGGRVIYEGSPSALLPSLLENSSLAKVTQAEQLNQNPAIVAIEVASGEYGPQIIDELAIYHEDQVYEQFSTLGTTFQEDLGGGGGGSVSAMASPLATPRALRTPRKSPLSVSRLDMGTHRKRVNSLGDNSIGRVTPIMAKRQLYANQLDRMSSITSLSYASTYDADLPEVTSKLKVDKRLRRSVVMKSHLFSHTWTLMQRCWLITTRDLFLMTIRIVGFLLVAAGTVQIFSNSLDPNQHICPKFESQVDDVIEYMASAKERLLNLEPIVSQSNAMHMFFFHLLLCITMVTSALTGLVFPMQMRMFVREYKNGWYSPSSFILSQTLAELPVDIIGPLITLLITYPLCNQPVSLYYWREIGYALVLVASSIICKSQAQIVGAFLMDSVENSVFISCVCVVGPALLSGIPIRIPHMATPLQIVSYGSFLRYSFESLMLLRYGYGMCPCDSDLVSGYPIEASERAIPSQLNNFARGIIDLNRVQANETQSLGDNSSAPNLIQSIDTEHDNLIMKFIRLITDAGNLMTPNSEQLGDCKQYRSLYLLSMDIPNDILPKWLAIMALMFIVSRILTYFVVKTVIKFRHS